MTKLALVLGAVALLLSGCDFPIGLSAEGREIKVQRFGSGPRAVVLVGGLHTGYEDNSRMIVEQLAAHVAGNPDIVPASVTLFVVSAANPDGTARALHTNARGVDLNRNWPSDDWISDACHPSTGCLPGLGGPAPLSEPETYALYHFLSSTRPEVTVVWHAEAPLVEANEVAGADRYGRAFAGAAGYPYIEEWSAYRITGQLIDALEQRLGLRAFDVELAACCQISPEEFERNLRGLTAMLQEVHGPTARPTVSPAARPTRTPTSRGLIPGVQAPDE